MILDPCSSRAGRCPGIGAGDEFGVFGDGVGGVEPAAAHDGDG